MNLEGGKPRSFNSKLVTLLTGSSVVLRTKFYVQNWLELSRKMAVICVVAPCSLADVYQRFRSRCCLHHQGHECTHRPETLVNFCQTSRRFNPEDGRLQKLLRVTWTSEYYIVRGSNGNRIDTETP